MQLEHLSARVRAKDFTHPDRPDFSRNPSERDVFYVESAIETERKPRRELIDRDTPSIQHLGVSETIRERVCSLLHRRRACLADVITTDRNRIPARHVRRCPFDHVAKKTERCFRRKNRFVLRL